MVRSHRKHGPSLVHALAVAAAVVAIVAVIWADVATGLWQNTVILSGIAAGLLTFVLTALFLDRLVALSDHKRWLPVTRLALTDLLHALADEQASELSRAQVVPRTLPVPEPLSPQGAEHLLAAVVAERQEITAALSRWAGFLAASADVQDLMRHVSQIASHLDAVRDNVLEFERHDGRAKEQRVLQDSIESYHQELRSAVAEIHGLLARP